MEGASNAGAALVRRIELYIRLGITGISLPLLLTAKHADSDIANGIYVGVITADLVTWVATTLLELPAHAATALIELVVLATAIGILQATIGLERPRAGEAEAIAFMVFLGVVAIKLGWWALKRIDADLRQM
jgi:predicted permease